MALLFIKHCIGKEQDISSLLYLRPKTGDGVHIVGYQVNDKEYMSSSFSAEKELITCSLYDLPNRLTSISLDWTTPNAEEKDNDIPFDSAAAALIVRVKILNLLLAAQPG
jgi:hypothetical protein